MMEKKGVEIHWLTQTASKEERIAEALKMIKANIFQALTAILTVSAISVR